MDARMMQGLFEDLGGASSGPIGVVRENDGSWTIRWDDIDILRAEWADGPPRLVSTVPLGIVAPARKLAVYEAMLTYNLLWRRTRGARLALGGPEGEATLVHEIQLDRMTVPALGAALARTCQIGSAWRRFVMREDPAEPSARPSPSMLA